MDSEFKPNKWVIYWLYLGITLVLTMVVVGGITRLTHSGLSMVHWSFTGSLPPLNDADWQIEFEKYQQTPEFLELNRHFDVQEFKSIFWWEFIHRMLGRTIGVVFLIPFLIFLIRDKIPRSMLGNFLVILGLGAFQGMLGWFMVKSGLVDVPRVSHFRLAAHLSLAFITCTYIFWVSMHYQNYDRITRSSVNSRPIWVLIFLLFIQIMYGAFVAGLKAAWIHNTWPLMDGSLIAPSVWALSPVWKNFLEGSSGVQFVHRTLALAIFGFAIWLAYFSKLTRIDDLKKSLKLVVLLIAIQFILGVSTLLLQVPILLGVLHQVMALVVVLAGVKLLFRARYSVEARNS